MFFKLFKYDIENGVLKFLYKYFIAAFVFSIFCIFITITQKEANCINSFGDYLFYITAGMKEYLPSSNEIFVFPSMWMILLLFPLYITLNYPFNDLTEFGKQVLINTQSRKKWWLSKCLWAISCIIIYFLLLWLVIGAFCLLLNISFSMSISQRLILSMVSNANESICKTESEYIINSQLMFQITIMPILVTSTLSVLQLLNSILLSQAFSFCISIGVLLFSSYFLNLGLIGNYAMSQRNCMIIDNGMSIIIGIIISLLVLIASVTIGLLIFEKYDILNKER